MLSPVCSAANRPRKPAFLWAVGIFARCNTFPGGEHSTRNQREFCGSRLSIFLEGSDRTVRQRQPVTLALANHLFNRARQELIDLSGVVDLAAALKKFQGNLFCLHE